jgi:hypothetical protein
MYRSSIKGKHSKLEQIEWFTSETLYVIREVLKLEKNNIEKIETFCNNNFGSCIVKFKVNKEQLLDVSGPVYFLLDFGSGEMKAHGIRFEKELKEEGTVIVWKRNKDSQTFYRHYDVSAQLNSIIKSTRK